MKIMLKPIALNETSYNVNLLHKALAALGLPVAKKEAARNRAGEKTLEQVRRLQAYLGVPIDESTLVDKVSAAAIADALKKMDLTAGERSFTVSGAVRGGNGEPIKRQLLLAFDLDLRGVAVFRAVKDLAEIEANGGFEFLGQAESDNQGRYRITFYDWQYRRAERQKADVVVYALDDDEVIGFSAIVDSDAYENGLVRELDIVITGEEEGTEYERLMSLLIPFLKESDVTLAEIATSPDQMAFTAGELEVAQAHLDLAAAAELLIDQDRTARLHELLYGIGRQNIRLSWPALYKKQVEELQAAVAHSVDTRIISPYADEELTTLLAYIRERSAQDLLDDQDADDDQNTLDRMLKNALPEKEQRLSFMNALGDFKGSDFRQFWEQYLPAQAEFKDRPELVSALLLTQQLTLLSGNHQKLVTELQGNRKVTAMDQLLELGEGEWLELLKTTGVPDFVEGDDEEERIKQYAGQMQSLLNAAFPTWRIAQMVASDELPIERNKVSRSISAFLAENQSFDVATSRVHDFDEEIEAAAGEEAADVRSELLKIQRVFQVSPSPEAMQALLENNLNSAYTIANIPRKVFIDTYAQALGGEQIAFATHQRASHISTRAEMSALHLREYSHGETPQLVMAEAEYDTAMATIQANLPNYSELFGSPDLCECEHCRSVYSAAAYFVDLLRFLERSGLNDNDHSPYDILVGKIDSNSNTVDVQGRRPDLAHLSLTCENTNTIIPYIDLANEVMEYYTAHNNSLANFLGHDTGEATAEELRANPLHFNIEAYRILAAAKHPFTLPYHQPLDVIRTYSDHLGASRYDVMKAINPQPAAADAQGIAAESLTISPEEHTVLTGKAFDGTDDTTLPHEHFGYSAPGDLGNLSVVGEFMQRTGVAYTDLVELLHTRFINTHQGTLDLLQRIFAASSLAASDIYAWLEEIEAGTLDAAGRSAIETVLIAYNNANDADLTFAEFEDWVTDHLDELRQAITLYEPDSKCSLETTELKTIRSIFEGSAGSGISESDWSRMHRFIRLWRILGWTVQQTDIMLAALGEADITPETIVKLEVVSLLQAATRLPIDQLAVLWGNIDTVGNQSLYKKLFLNKAVQQIDEAFIADIAGNYLQDESAILAAHQSAILAAFGIREEDLAAILEVARVVDGNNARPINFDTDMLDLQNLSTIFRFVVLTRGLKMRLSDVCRLNDLFEATPFSIWDIQQEAFTNISPQDTFKFYELAASTKQAGFNAAALEYILQGTLPAESTLGLDPAETLQTAKAIRDALAIIEQEHPTTLETPTPDLIAAKLSLTFQPETVRRFMDIIAGTAVFDTITDLNLNVTIPPNLATKYTYSNGSGRLSCSGIMSDDERDALKDLPNSNANFETAVDDLYTAPETFISDNFNGVFDDLSQANEILLDHPAQATPASLEEKFDYVYEHFLPLLKNKLRQDVVIQHLAALIGLSETATAVLIGDDMANLVADLSEQGFSGAYFNAIDWDDSDLALERTDRTVDFSWGLNAPHEDVSANNFSARWKAYISAPATGAYTFVVTVEEADEAFNLYLDDMLILAKPAGDLTISRERDIELNAAQMHLLALEYAETSQNAAIKLSWKTATTALEAVPSSVAYPADILDEFVNQATRLHRAAQFISGFDINETELYHFISHPADFSDINFKALEVQHWQRIRDYTILRQAAPQAQALLTDVFVLAAGQNPAPTIADLTHKLSLATAWDQANLSDLVTHFVLVVDDFKNEIALNRLRLVMQIVAKTGFAAKSIAKWGKVETDFDELRTTAQSLKNSVKAKYDAESWLDVARNLNDKIRENQKQALITHLLVQPDIQNNEITDADGLFEYFLIDVQMGACMDTSRIVQAAAAIQLFVNRCLLNLELGVSPGAIDQDRWQWMKNYRVWEANRKVFLYPENFLEWRDDRSAFFRDLESHLVQNDITQRSVEQGFRNYLTSLNEVANLEVCGMYQENDGNGNLKLLHVFARTHNAPYKFFYRTYNKYLKWSAWERVQLDIRSVENGEKSGVHLLPVVWKNRLFLFWPEFAKVLEESSTSKNQTFQDMGENRTVANLEAKEYWEIRLAWSEYVDRQWSPKQVSKEFIKQERHFFVPDESKIWIASEIERDKLSIHLATEGIILFGTTGSTNPSPTTVATSSLVWDLSRRFELADIASKVNVDGGGLSLMLKQWGPTYSINFMNFSSSSSLNLLDNTYLDAVTNHKLLLTAKSQNLNPSFDEPFFFSDAYRTYFTRPVSINVVDWLTHPDLHPPVIEALYDANRIGTPADTSNLRTPGLTPIVAGQGLTAIRYAAEAGHIGVALSGEDEVALSSSSIFRSTKGLEFHTFYHPYSSQYVTNLNQGGLSRGNKPSEEYPPGLMESDTELSSDDGNTFVNTYSPNFSSGLVQKPADFDERTYYKENVCFDPYGANSLYNWELFFHAPLYIATRLSKDGKHKEAEEWFHYIFDPTTNETPQDGESETSRYWKVLPFKTPPDKSLEDWFRELSPNTDPNNPGDTKIAEWRDNPFNAHLVAGNRPVAYMKHVVVKYVENLLAWGDSLFRQFTRESVNEAIQIYVIANHILGPRPEFVPKRGAIQAESYASLQDRLDDFSNALVELENIFPYSSEVSVGALSTGSSLLGIGSAFYFCIPANDKLLEYWDTVADRLFKIRHCQDIDGVERSLALFAPPIDPAALIQAAQQGLSLGSILADLSSPPPIYRFSFLIQKANEFCAEVKALGSALLAALEKKDAEELSRLRASHETNMLELVTAIRERQVLTAKANKENLLKARETAVLRLQHYIDLLGNDSVTIPAEPTIEATLTADSQLPGDTSIATIETDVDDSLVEADERGVKLIDREKVDIDKSEQAKWWITGANSGEALAGIFNLFPNVEGEIQPLGVGVGTGFGGPNLGAATSALARAAQAYGQYLSLEASNAGRMASYIRREQDWTLQANLAAREIIQMDKQITSADIQIQMAEKELQNHEQQIENAEIVESFLADKFTNQELYQWMKEQLFAVYKQSYNLAYDMAKKAEIGYRYELGLETTNFIQYGYWESARHGLVSGDKLQLALRHLEKSYLEGNRRDLELTNNNSLLLLNPLALIELRETGKCIVELPEELFDLDFQGHYFRRIKGVSLSIPCIAGPFTTVNCSLRLLSNTTRINTSLNDGYEHANDDGLWIDDDRFRASNVPVTSIATSRGQSDSGMFEFSFRDERYLPFEGAGVISRWAIELSTHNELRQFDYSTIADVILQLNYTAREGGSTFKEDVQTHIMDFIMNTADRADQPLMRMLSLKHEFPTAWHKFLHPTSEGDEQLLKFTIGQDSFPFFAQDRQIVVMKIEVLAKCTEAEPYPIIVTYNDGTVTSPDDVISLQSNDSFGGLNTATINVNDAAGLNLEDLDVTRELSLKIKRNSAQDFSSLSTNPDEIEDLYLVVHYKLN